MLCKDNHIKLIFVRQMACANAGLFLDDSFSWEKMKTFEKRYPNGDSYRKQYYHNSLMKLQKELCENSNVAFLDFKKEFYKAMEDNEKPFRDVVHFTVRGDDLLAMLVSDNISGALKQ